MIDNENPPVLYVLMRTDLPDYLAGKAMAQANHVGTLLAEDMYNGAAANDSIPLYKAWLAEGGGFGTCIVLGVTRAEMFEATLLATRCGLDANIVTDKEYPVKDGNIINHMPVQTCGYIFGSREDCAPITKVFRLFRDERD